MRFWFPLALLVLTGCADLGPGPVEPTAPVDAAPPIPPSPPVHIGPGEDGPIVLIKADDFVHDWRNAGSIHPRWREFMAFIEGWDLKAGVGLEGKSLITGEQGYLEALRAAISTGRFEVFNHGLTHSLEGADPAWGAKNEFEGTPLWFQKDHLRRTQDLAHSLLGVRMVAFGSPGNVWDSATVQIVAEDPDIQIWFFGSPAAGKVVVNTPVTVESPIPHPNFNHFVSGYQDDLPVMLIQVHPGSWAEGDMSEFARVISYLRERHARFILPGELLSAVPGDPLESGE